MRGSMKKKVIIPVLAAISLISFYALFHEMERNACFSQNISISKKWDMPERPNLKVLILGDTGTGDQNQKQVAAASAATCKDLGCDLVLYLGDNFYPEGVKDIEDRQFSERFEDIYPQKIPFCSILGNHDVKGDWKAQIEYTNRSQRWYMPETNYDFSAGPVHFYAVNTNCSPLSMFKLKTDSSKGWNIVFGHHSYVSSGNHAEIDFISRFFMDRSDFDIYISGHQHLLEHLEKDGKNYIISGGGGGPLQSKEKENSSFSRFVARKHGYVWAEFGKESAKFIFYDQDGKKIYDFSRKKDSVNNKSNGN